MSRPAPSRPRSGQDSKPGREGSGAPSEFKSLRNHQFLAGVDCVRIPQDIAIGIEDLRVLIGVTVELAADFRKRISRFHRIGSLVLSSADGRPRGHGRRPLLCLQNTQIAGQIGETGIDQFDLVPDLVLDIG